MLEDDIVKYVSTKNSIKPILKQNKTGSILELTQQQFNSNVGENMYINLNVHLIHLYIFMPIDINIIRNRICESCNGFTCNNNFSLKCQKCENHGVYPQEKKLTLYLQGRSHNDNIIFKGEGDEKPGKTAGDIIVIINQIPDPAFSRDGPHLYIKKKISLVEALIGGDIYIKHLDHRILHLPQNCGETIRPYHIKCIPNEGMPYPDNVDRYGHLFIQFEVEFPHKLIGPIVQVLKHTLPPSNECDTLKQKIMNNPSDFNSRIVHVQMVDLNTPIESKEIFHTENIPPAKKKEN